jgi:hypothetical protein
MGTNEFQAYVLSFEQGFFRFGGCSAKEQKTTFSRIANASPLLLLGAYVAPLPGFAFKELVTLLAERRLAEFGIHSDWFRTDEPPAFVLDAIAEACKPDQLVLQWESVGTAHVQICDARMESSFDRPLRRARASIRSSLENEAFFAGAPRRYETTESDVRDAYHR